MWPGLGGVAGATPSSSGSSTSAAPTNADIMAVLVDLKNSFKNLSDRVEKLIKGLGGSTTKNAETKVCSSAESRAEREKPDSIAENECVSPVSKEVSEPMQGNVDDDDGEEAQGEVEVSRSYIIDMCREMQQVADQLMARVEMNEAVKISLGSVSHTLFRVLGDAKYN